MPDRSIAGIKIGGDFHSGRNFVEQKPEYELGMLITSLLFDLNVVAFGWRQYTPYFNDGDPCEFGAHGLWVKTVWDKDVDEDEDDEWGDDEEYYSVDYGDGVIGAHTYDNSTGTYRRMYGNMNPVVARVRENAQALDAAIQSGAFDLVLLEKFGDHASIRATKEGFEVSTYDHD